MEAERCGVWRGHLLGRIAERRNAEKRIIEADLREVMEADSEEASFGVSNCGGGLWRGGVRRGNFVVAE